jgi:hypothetical protein
MNGKITKQKGEIKMKAKKYGYRKNIIIVAIIILTFIFQSSIPLFAQTDPYRDRYDRMGTYNGQWSPAQKAYQSGQKAAEQSKDTNTYQATGANTDERQEANTEPEYTCEGNACTAYDDEGRVTARYGYDENGSYYEEYTYNDDGTVASYSRYEYSDPDAAEKYNNSCDYYFNFYISIIHSSVCPDRPI